MTDWPLHITLADVFAINLGSDLVKKLKELFSDERPVITAANKDAVLGEAKVVLLEKNDKIKNLHQHLVDLLESNGAVFNNPEFTKEGFLPHCTIQKDERLNLGDKIIINEITLVDMFPNNNWKKRKVLYSFKLKGE